MGNLVAISIKQISRFEPNDFSFHSMCNNLSLSIVTESKDGKLILWIFYLKKEKLDDQKYLLSFP